LKEIWTTGAGQFFPLVLTTFWIEHALWGLWPLPYHLVNVLVHGLDAILLWRVLRSLEVPGAWLGAALWALHPVQVESVAWISELKNTQSCFFYLLTMLFFLRWLGERDDRGGGRGSYALTLLCALLAMASKTPTGVLPAVLALCAWWRRGRIDQKTLVCLAPMLAMAVVAAAITMWPQATPSEEISDPQWARSWPERFAIMGDSTWFYLGKLVWPHPLMAVYPRWEIDTRNGLSYLPLLFAVGIFFILWRERGGWARPWFFAAAYYLVTMLPFLGLVNQGFWRYSFVEDHLQYLSGMGPLALAGGGIATLANRTGSLLWRGGGACLALLLGLMSWQRAWVFEDEVTFWSDTLKQNRACWLGYIDLDHALVEEGRIDEAVRVCEKLVEMKPGYAQGWNNLGNALLEAGRVDEAIPTYQKALAIDPGLMLAHFNLGVAWGRAGNLNREIAEYRKALAIDATIPEIHLNLANALLATHQTQEAVAQYMEVLRLSPDDTRAEAGLAAAQGSGYR
jgi:tetratricopeptide (TPR) repeat protein